MNRSQFQDYLEKNSAAKLRDVVAEVLYDEIISLRIAPGSKLNVNSIASSLGISRTPVADAINTLYDKGFVVSKQLSSGYFVIDLNLHDMIELYDVRTAIECEAAALCTEHADEATIAELVRLADCYRDAVLRGDHDGMAAYDMPFHAVIVNNCGNRYIQKCYEMLLPNLTMYQASMIKFFSSSDGNPWSASITYNHNAIAEAIKMRIPELAREAMSSHVTSGLNYATHCGGGADPFAFIRNPKMRK